jgi:hypothetical protein
MGRRVAVSARHLPTFGYRGVMTTSPQEPDPDAEPPTPDNEEPDADQLDEASSEPGSHPDPDPGASPSSDE